MNHKHLIQTFLSLACCTAVAIALRTSFIPSASAAATPPAQTAGAEGAIPAAEQTLAALQSSRPSSIVADVSRETGAYTFVRSEGADVLAADNPLASPEDRARVFLAAHGALVGMNDGERAAVADASRAAGLSMPGSALEVSRTFTDDIGATHVKFNQTYRGLKVFGAQLIVHMNGRGITAVNGNFIPDIAVDPNPTISEAAAAENALESVAKAKSVAPANLIVGQTELAVFRTGLLEGYQGSNVLAYGVKIADAGGPLEQVWVSAATGAELIRIPLK
ncbi:MAG TPA: hypothetical protein VF683_06420, partial [Chthoniobacterales bacterium]